MKHHGSEAFEVARRLAAGEALDADALRGLDAKLARGLQRVAAIARRDSGEGERWGHLEGLRFAGSGSFGDVYRAYDPTLDRDVALKLRREDAATPFASGRDFVAEARRLARVRHPNVLAVHGASYHGDRAGLWTDWIDGETLHARLQREPRLPDGLLWRLARELAAALAAVHDVGLVHGDVKPANVMLDARGHALLMDFGASLESASGAALGQATPRYLAPECARGAAAQPAADVYALGMLLFRAAAGGYPDDGGTVRPPALAALVGAMLDADPARRPTPADVSAAVDRALAAPLRRAQRLALAAVVGGLAAIALIATVAYRRADALRVEAEQALEGTARANRFLTDLLALSSPDELGPTATLRELLDVAPDVARAHFEHDVHGRGLMLATLARIESELANDERAAVLAREAAYARELDDPQSAETLFAKAGAIELRALAGAPDAALAEMRQLLAASATRADAARVRPRLLVGLAEVEFRAWLRNTQPALRQSQEAHLGEALAARANLDPSAEIRALRRLGTLRYEQARDVEGAELLRTALQRSVAAHGDDAAATALTRRLLAWQLMERPETMAESEALFRENLTRHRERTGPRSRTVIDDEFGLAQSLSLQGRHADALPLAESAWTGAGAAYGPTHRTTIDAGVTYARVLDGSGRRADATALLDALRDRIAGAWGRDTRHFVNITHQLADVTGRNGEPARSAALFAECAADAERLLGRDHVLAMLCRERRSR